MPVIEQVSLVLSAMQAPVVPENLDHASALLTGLMQTSYHPTYRLHLLPHRFVDEGEVAGIYAGGTRVGDTRLDAVELDAAWKTAGETLGEPEIQLSSAVSDPEVRESQQIAGWTLAELMPEAEFHLQQLVDSGETFVTGYWTCRSGGYGRCGRTQGTLWAQAMDTQMTEQVAQQAVTRVVDEAPLEVELRLRELADQDPDGLVGALAAAQGLTVEQLSDRMEERGFPDQFEITLLVDETLPVTDELGHERPIRPMEALKDTLMDAYAMVAERMRVNYDDITASLRGTLYSAEEVFDENVVGEGALVLEAGSRGDVMVISPTGPGLN